MEITYYHIDTFTQKLFTGNAAAVVILEHWLSDTAMQHIAAELNLSETAFVAPVNTHVNAHANHYAIRWFAPAKEVELCGHATLASAHVLFHHYQIEGSRIVFDSASGELPTTLRSDGQLELV